MRDPHRWRTIGLWRLGPGALSLAWLWMRAGHRTGVSIALFFFGAVGIVLAAEGSRAGHFRGFVFFTADFLAPFFALLPRSRTSSEFPLPKSALAARFPRESSVGEWRVHW